MSLPVCRCGESFYRLAISLPNEGQLLWKRHYKTKTIAQESERMLQEQMGNTENAS